MRAYGREAVSFQSVTSDCRYWFARDACVAYVESGAAWVAIGSPLASVGRESEVATAFSKAAQQAGKRALFFGTERAWPRGGPFRLMVLGEQPIWQPSEWPRALSPKLHRQIRQQRARGRVTVREVFPQELQHAKSPARRGIDRVERRWLASRKMAPMGFLVRLNLYDQANERRYFVAEHDGESVAVMIAMPVYAQHGWLLETCIRCPSAPSGAMELVFDFAMRSFAAERSLYVSYGLCPLTGTSSWLHRLVRESSRALYDFDGLRQFKSKFKPARWQPVYLTYPRTELPARALLDVLGAFCPRGILAFGSQTLWRRAHALAQKAPGRRRSNAHVSLSLSC
ncbi:MAG: hypothetical protein JWN04_6834 [Myxococcaceae bacterium]|nr:hypothetical protein [Myxococcaceae bacterium]